MPLIIQMELHHWTRLIWERLIMHLNNCFETFPVKRSDDFNKGEKRQNQIRFPLSINFLISTVTRLIISTRNKKSQNYICFSLPINFLISTLTNYKINYVLHMETGRQHMKRRVCMIWKILLTFLNHLLPIKIKIPRIQMTSFFCFCLCFLRAMRCHTCR